MPIPEWDLPGWEPTPTIEQQKETYAKDVLEQRAIDRYEKATRPTHSNIQTLINNIVGLEKDKIYNGQIQEDIENAQRLQLTEKYYQKRFAIFGIDVEDISIEKINKQLELYKEYDIAYNKRTRLFMTSYHNDVVNRLCYVLANFPFARELSYSYAYEQANKVDHLKAQRYANVIVTCIYDPNKIVYKDEVNSCDYGKAVYGQYKNRFRIDIPQLMKVNYWDTFYLNRPPAYIWENDDIVEIPHASMGWWIVTAENIPFGIMKVVQQVVTIVTIAITVFGVPAIGGLIGKVINACAKTISYYKKGKAIANTIEAAASGDILAAIKSGANLIGGDIAKTINYADTVYQAGNAVVEGNLSDALIYGGRSLGGDEGYIMELSGKAITGDLDAIEELGGIIAEEYLEDITFNPDIIPDVNLSRFIPDITLPNINLPKVDLPDIKLPSINIPLLQNLNADKIVEIVEPIIEKTVEVVETVAEVVKPIIEKTVDVTETVTEKTVEIIEEVIPDIKLPDITLPTILPEVNMSLLDNLENLGKLYEDTKVALLSSKEAIFDVASIFDKQEAAQDVVKVAEQQYQDFESQVDIATNRLADNYLASKLKEYWPIVAIVGVVLVIVIAKK